MTDTTRDLSSRYVLMLAPVTRPAPSKSISTNFPKREELSFLTVLALPKASSSGLDSSTCTQTLVCVKMGFKASLGYFICIMCLKPIIMAG